MGLFDKLAGRKRPAGRLAGLIAGYPPYVAPANKAPAALSVAEAEANLSQLLQVRAARLDGFAALLSRFGLDLRAGLAAASPAPFLDQLWRWTLDEWPAIHDPALAAYHARLGPRSGDPVFGLLTDTALALGEMILVRAPGWGWALNLHPADKRMPSWRQPCVSGPGASGPTVAFHAEQIADSAYAGCLKGGYLVENLLARSVMDCLRAAAPGPVPSAGSPAKPASRQRSTLYDKADDHRVYRDDDEAAEAPGGAHLALFVAWAARHGLLAAGLDRQAAGLRDGSTAPMQWLCAHADGCLVEANLNEAGNRFTRAYYGTPEGGLHDGPGSYLHDFLALLAPDGEGTDVPSDWASYAVLAPRLDERYAAFEK